MLVCLDWECAYGTSPSGRKVTLSAMTTEEYVRDPEFLAHGVGIKVNDGPPRYYYGAQIEQVLRLLPWGEIYLLCHHTQLDGAILAWRYGIYPKFYLDTISMAQAIYNHVPANLAYLSEFLGLGTKGKELATVKDKWFLTEEEQKVMEGYCATNPDSDVNLTYRIFQELKKGFPVSEFETINDTIWMFTNPVFEINTTPLIPAYAQEVQRKADLVAATGRVKTEFTSNQKFALLLESRDVKVPMKINKNGEATFAFAKTDEEFLALEFHPDPVVKAYVAARLGTKTSIVETRIKRFIEIGGRGRLPAYIKANSAHTGRPGGGDKSNLLNMSNRGTGLVIRESMEAPEGHSIVVADLSQIEARILVNWAGQEDRVEMFRQGGDPYNNMASDLYGRPIDRKNVLEDKKPGNVGKATVLGCFGPDTLVVTSRGLVKIVDIQLSDMVWDGEAFVKHKGLINQGEKECLTSCGLTATKDHEILTEHGWREWQEVHTNHSLFLSALSLVISPFKSGEGGSQEDISPIAAASVVGRGSSTETISRQGGQPDAISARSKQAGRRARSIVAMLTSYLMTIIENACSIAYRLAYQDATTRTTASTTVMEGEGSEYSNRGSMIENYFSDILSRLKGGISRTSNSTGPTTIKATSRRTFGSAQEEKIATTPELSRVSRKRSMTYDIAYAGPRNRYAVMTDCGPILAHNCGYGLGWQNFQGQLRVGFLGMDGVIYGQDYVDQLNVSLEAFKVGRSWAGFVNLEEQALSCLPLGMDPQEHLTHCAVVWTIVNRYRETNPRVKALWKTMNNAMAYMMAGQEVEIGPIKTVKDGLLLPNGKIISYTGLRKSKKTGDYSYLKQIRGSGYQEWVKLYGGKIVENCVQGMAWILLSGSITDTRKAGYNVALPVYDEQVSVVPTVRAQACGDFVYKRLCTPPVWMPNLPLDASIDIVQNYAEAK